MSQIYQEFTMREGDSRDERIAKLYLGIISVGEDLYCVGSNLSEIKKRLDSIETTVANFRKALCDIKGTHEK